jgi:predicted AAA+ superfamily ATPase
MTVGGFPRSFLDTDLREARPRPRPEDWYDGIIKDDIRDVENIKNIQQISMPLQFLRERAGCLIVVSNLAKD